MVKAIKTISSRELENQKRILGLIMIAIIIVGILYVYFAGSTIFQIINKNNNIKHFQEISFRYQQLEESYLKIIDEVDLNYTYSLGFVEQKGGNFAVRQTTVAQR